MTTLDDVLTRAQQLHAADKLRLIARLAPDLAAELPDNADDDDGWDDLLRYGAETATLPPLAEDSAVVLSSMRR